VPEQVLATRQDLQILRLGLTRDLQTVRLELTRDFDKKFNELSSKLDKMENKSDRKSAVDRLLLLGTVIAVIYVVRVDNVPGLLDLIKAVR
jgi:hypothetical protein